jgi:hypothetical protein
VRTEVALTSQHIMTLSRHSLAALFLLTSSTFGWAFVGLSPAQLSFQSTGRRVPQQRTDLRAVELVFDGDCLLVSDPLPRDVSKEELIEFLHKKESRNYFFSAGGTRVVDELEMTPEFKSMWQDEYAKLNNKAQEFMMPNDEGDSSVIGCEAKINFPGLLLTSTTISGVRKFQGKNDGDFPEYQVLGIAEQQRVEGPAPVVWLYSQLTGLNKKEKGKFYPPSAAARSTISVVEKEGGYAFSFDVKLKIVTQVPTVLIKILPTSIEKMEEQGGAAVSKTVAKDMEASITHVRKIFLAGRKVVA